MLTNIFKALLGPVVFAQPYWLWGLLLIPLVLLYFRFAKFFKLLKVFRFLKLKLSITKVGRSMQLAKLADQHLLPHLIQKDTAKKRKTYLLALWCLLWGLGIIAMAGPRWKFTTYETYEPDAALVVLLDLSQSMSASDLKPSRMIRAKQQIHDLLNMVQGVRVGLIGFAKVPHLITPITDDFTTVLYLLPAVDYSLVRKQGSGLVPALTMAQKLLQAELGDKKHILLISDGSFNNTKQTNYRDILSNLKKDNIVIHVLGVGTEQGAPFKDRTGNWTKQQGQMVITKLAVKTLRDIAQLGLGYYWEISYTGNYMSRFVNRVKGKTTSNKVTKNTVKQWEEGFMWLIFPMLLLALIVNRGHLRLGMFALAIILFSNSNSAVALDLFHNSEQQGEVLFNDNDYNGAAGKFSDHYHKGVALYKAGRFAEAEQAFQLSNRQEINIASRYNLGNAQLMQQKHQQAIKSYEQLLRDHPEHESAKNNLAIAKKLAEQQQEDQEKDKQQQEDKSNCSCGNKSDNKNNNNEQQKDATDKQAENKGNSQGKSANADKQADQQREKQSAAESDIAKGNKDDEVKQNEEQKQEVANAMINNAADKDKKQAMAKVDPETEQWLKLLNNDIKVFLRNKFFIEEQQTQQGSGE